MAGGAFLGCRRISLGPVLSSPEPCPMQVQLMRSEVHLASSGVARAWRLLFPHSNVLKQD